MTPWDDALCRRTKQIGGLLAAAATLVLSLPFCYLGLREGWRLAGDVCDWYAMRSWEETTATLLSSGLDDKGPRPGIRVGPRSAPSDCVTASYSYVYAGRQYIGRRVGVHEAADNLGGVQLARLDALRRARNEGGAFRCYVNPQRPSDSVLFRELRLGLAATQTAFAGSFAGAGLLMAASVIGPWTIRVRKVAAARRFPEKPWLWRQDWAAGRIHAKVDAGTRLLIFFAVAWNALCWCWLPPTWKSLASDAMGERLLVILFPLVGLLTAGIAGYLCLRQLKWRHAELYIPHAPGVLGGYLRGLIRLPGPLQALGGLSVELECRERGSAQIYQQHKDPNGRLEWSSCQSDVRHFPSRDQSHTLIPIEIFIPYGLPSSAEPYYWRLIASAATDGIDFHAVFDVPVFQTAESSPEARSDRRRRRRLSERRTHLSQVIARLGGSVEEEADNRIAFRISAGDDSWLLQFRVAAGALLLMVAAGLILMGVPALMWSIFAGLGALMLYALLNDLRGVRLKCETAGVAVRPYFAGLPGPKRTLAANDIVQIESSSHNTWFGAGRSVVTAKGRSGRDYTLLAGPIELHDARYLARRIATIIGVDYVRLKSLT